MPEIAGTAIRWWDGRTRRERWMLAALSILVSLTVLWLAVWRPALGWREGAAERRLRAVVAATAVDRDLARLTVSGARPSPAGSDGLEPTVRRTADTAGLDPSLSMAPEGGLAFQLASVPSGAALAWLAALESDQHLRLCRLAVVENADATVSIEGSLASGDCAAPRPGS